jgi:hypothetical protein
MSEKHKPTPWRVFYDSGAGCWAIRSAPCQVNARWMDEGYLLGVYAFEEDAEYIVACANFCSTFPTPALASTSLAEVVGVLEIAAAMFAGEPEDASDYKDRAAAIARAWRAAQDILTKFRRE